MTKLAHDWRIDVPHFLLVLLLNVRRFLLVERPVTAVAKITAALKATLGLAAQE